MQKLTLNILPYKYLLFLMEQRSKVLICDIYFMSDGAAWQEINVLEIYTV
jgi:hypothetical protein